MLRRSGAARSAAVAACVLVFCLVAATTPAMARDAGAEDLGTPITSVTVADAAYGRGPAGERWMYLVVGGTPAVLNVIDVPTGRRVHRFPLEGSKRSWGLDVAPDQTLYVGSADSGFMYRWTPGAEAVENLGRPVEGESYVYRVAFDEQGRVYGCTYPSGKVFRYDPQTGDVRDYGRMAEGNDYARDLAVVGRAVFVGTGSQRGQLIALDAETGDRSEILLPETYRQAAERVHFVEHIAGYLFADVRPHKDVLIYDLEAGKWVGQIEAMPSPPGPDGRLYFVSDEGLQRFDPATGEQSSTGFAAPFGSNHSFGWVDLKDPDFPGLSLVQTDMRGRYWIYNPQTGRGTRMAADAGRQPVIIRSLFHGPDNQIYIGGYLSPGMISRYDPRSETFTRLPGVSQVEGFCMHDGVLSMGVYPNGLIMAYDTAREWGTADNPQRLFRLGESQDRPFAITSAGDRLAIGTVPVVGSLGGALSLYHPETGEVDVYRHVIQDQSVVSVAYRDGVVIGGTSVSGGLGIEPTTDEGRLFFFDVASRRVIWQGAPIPGARSVTGLTFDDEGRLWGVADSHVFVFDAERREAVRTVNLFPERPSQEGAIWTNGYLSLFGDGHVYGQARGSIFRLSLSDWRAETIATDVRNFAQDHGGNIYFSRGAHLYRLPYEVVRSSRER